MLCASFCNNKVIAKIYNYHIVNDPIILKTLIKAHNHCVNKHVERWKKTRESLAEKRETSR